jgi:hypothetical protein
VACIWKFSTRNFNGKSYIKPIQILPGHALTNWAYSDYRKLTFYFYAEKYINFNEIVCDLFKVWKTRIWMASVNPETYAAPPGAKEGRDERRMRREIRESHDRGEGSELHPVSDRLNRSAALHTRGSTDQDGNIRYSIPELLQMAGMSANPAHSHQLPPLPFGVQMLSSTSPPSLPTTGSHGVMTMSSPSLRTVASSAMSDLSSSANLGYNPNMTMQQGYNGHNSAGYQQVEYGGPYAGQSGYGAPNVGHYGGHFGGNHHLGGPAQQQQQQQQQVLFNGLRLDPRMQHPSNASAQMHRQRKSACNGCVVATANDYAPRIRTTLL